MTTEADNCSKPAMGITWRERQNVERTTGEVRSGEGNSGNNNSSNKSSISTLPGGVRLSVGLMKSLRRKAAAASAAASAGTSHNSSEVGSNNSSNIEGNNSDNSALVSLGNTSFGFNFDDSEEGMSNASPPSPDQSDSDGGGGGASSGPMDAKTSTTTPQNPKASETLPANAGAQPTPADSSTVVEGRKESSGPVNETAEVQQKEPAGASGAELAGASGAELAAASIVSSDTAEPAEATAGIAAITAKNTISSSTASMTPTEMTAPETRETGETETKAATITSTSTLTDTPALGSALVPEAAGRGAGMENTGTESQETTGVAIVSEDTQKDANPAPPQGNSSAAFHSLAAEAAVAELHSIASSSMCTQSQQDEDGQEAGTGNQSSKKRRRFENDGGGYNSDDESSRMAGNTGVSQSEEKPEDITSTMPTSQKELAHASDDNNTVDSRGKKKKRLDDKKREERNAREKERSFRISKQINELRNLLSTGGVIVPKGTKSSVLTETANYIRMLQQHQYRAEIDRHQLVQQIQIIAGGAHGPQAAAAIRHVAAQNGVMSFDNISAAPLKAGGNNIQYVQQPNNGAVMEVTTSAMAAPSADTATSTTTSAADTSMQEQQQVQSVQPLEQVRIEDYEYRFVFNNCSVGMAVASMGGAFIDCNKLFCKLSSYSKQEISALTIFNLTARQDLQHAFDLISRLISPSGGVQNQSVQQQPVVLRGAMNNGNDLGLSVTLVKAEDGIAKCFCVTLIKNPTSPFDDARPIPATIELVYGDSGGVSSLPNTARQTMKDGCSGSLESPAFTSG